MAERGFLRVERVGARARPQRAGPRLPQCFTLPDDETLREQGGRCMDCGVPFCHEGCPLGNQIPDWNDLVYRGQWQDALEQLHATNNFPEFTGLICPAPCESACVLGINDDPVTIKQIELAIVERGFDEGWVEPTARRRAPWQRSAWSAPGPPGWPSAAELNTLGHKVIVYERDEGPGGLLRFGVPDFKLEKWIIDRRVALLEAEGIEFACDVDVGGDVEAEELRSRHDAVVLAIGSRLHATRRARARARRSPLAMDYLLQRNRSVSRGGLRRRPTITAAGKHVIVIGGGDTGTDCIATAHREGAQSVTQLDIYPPPRGQEARQLASGRLPEAPWSTYALDEGGKRYSSFNATAFTGNGRVAALTGDNVGSPPEFEPTGETLELPADLVLIAIGFTGPSARCWTSSASTGSAAGSPVRLRHDATACSRPATRAAASP